jgi:hypothetical protein
MWRTTAVNSQTVTAIAHGRGHARPHMSGVGRFCPRREHRFPVLNTTHMSAHVPIRCTTQVSRGRAAEPAVALVASLRTRPWPLAMPLMFVLAGVCAILVGPLHMDCSPTVSAVCKSREAAGLLSWHHYAHEWVSLDIKVSLLLTGFAFARSAATARRSGSSTGEGGLSCWPTAGPDDLAGSGHPTERRVRRRRSDRRGNGRQTLA